jgi:hypothetical protein
MVDHTVSVSFGLHRKEYVRIQVHYPHIFLLCPADKSMDTIDMFPSRYCGLDRHYQSIAGLCAARKKIPHDLCDFFF